MRFKTHKHYNFWMELEPFYEYFMENKALAEFKIDGSGKYLVVGAD